MVIEENEGCWDPLNTRRDFVLRQLWEAAKTEFAEVWGHRISSLALSEMITGIDDQHNETPSAFALHHYVPNPFIASTTVSFTIPSRSFVSLKNFDALGKEVSTVVYGDLDVGQHSYEWNGSGLRSGVYFCRLQAGSEAATRKLSLLR
jgi:hypothetical protein